MMRQKWPVWLDIVVMLWIVFFGIIPEANGGHVFWLILNVFVAFWWMDQIGKDMLK